MKNSVLLAFFMLMVVHLHAQETVGGKVVKRAKDKTVQRGEQKTDQAIDKTLDKVEEGIGNIFKKKEKSSKKDPKTSSKKESGESADSENEEGSDSGATAGTAKAETKKAATKPNSKFDFVPGEKELYFDNFERLAIGDFPAEFNTNASGEVVNVSGKNGKWLSMTKNGVFIPESIKELPENFTLEFEVGLIGDPGNNYSGLALNFTTEKDQLFKDVLFGWSSSILYLHPGADLTSIQILPASGENEINNEIPMPQWSQNGNNFAKVSIWRQKGRLRVYLNEDKLVDAPRFFAESKPYRLAFSRRFFEDCDLLMTNIRFAVAGGDNRNKLLTEGKFSTNEILFDVNSDKIKPESNKIITEIGTLLTENPGVKVKIIGHTDSDGDAAANLALSKKRAEAVRTRLIYGFGIDETRLISDGKGESVPLNTNKNSEEKSLNRRVEFIKL